MCGFKQVTISLGKYYKKAYKRGISLKLFETKKGAAAKKAAQPLDATKPIVVLDDGEDIPPEEDEALAAAAPVGARIMVRYRIIILCVKLCYLFTLKQ